MGKLACICRREKPPSRALFNSRDYRILAQELKTLGDPLLICLEGGYDLESIGANAMSFAQGPGTASTITGSEDDQMMTIK